MTDKPTPLVSDYDRYVQPQPDVSAMITQMAEGNLALKRCFGLPVADARDATACVGAGFHHGLDAAGNEHVKTGVGAGVRIRLPF